MENPTGKIAVVFRKKRTGNTYLARQYYKLPLQIMTPYYQDDDGTVFLYLLNPGGGILQHDRLMTELYVEQQGKVLVTTPSNTKFYRMDDGYAHIVNRVTLEGGATMEYLPEYNVPYGGSNTIQENIFYLAGDSVLIASDMVTAGRASRGEVFAYDRYRSSTKIYVDGRLRAFDSCNIEPKSEDIARIGLMEHKSSSGTFYLYKKDIAAELLEKINKVKSGFSGVQLGASQVDDSLMVVRMIGDSIPNMRDAAAVVWDLSRRQLLGKGAVRIRKY